MEIEVKVRERFCKNLDIPIKLYHEPYFSDRLKLFDPFYNTLSKWKNFTKELEKYTSMEDYFAEYDRVKEEAIASIKGTLGYEKFNQMDLGKCRVKNTQFSSHSIFKDPSVDRFFISIDQRQANFTALHHFDDSIFGGAATWEDFLSRFTDNQSIINSKFVRSVILGNCNPKRHMTYEKFLMDSLLSRLLESGIDSFRIDCFLHDEIVIDVTDLRESDRFSLLSRVKSIASTMPSHYTIKLFSLHKITGIREGYWEKIYREDNSYGVEFKCVPNLMLPFVLRKFLGQEPLSSDGVFWFEGMLAQLLEIPEINFGGTVPKEFSC